MYFDQQNNQIPNIVTQVNKRYAQLHYKLGTGRVFNNCSGVARAFPGGWLAHPDDQNEEEN